MSAQQHHVFAPVLQVLAYDALLRGQELHIVYADGSKGAAFPLGCLEWNSHIKPFASRPKLRLGLGSHRHPELDFLVDMYVARNRELNDCHSMADEDSYTFDRTVAILTEPGLPDDLAFFAYQTGLQPMVAGFLRAVAYVLKQRRTEGLPRRLVVQSKLFDGKRSERPYTPDSRGARDSHYQTCTPWW